MREDQRKTLKPVPKGSRSAGDLDHGRTADRPPIGRTKSSSVIRPSVTRPSVRSALPGREELNHDR
jgi:hypothetical protein